MHYGINIFPTSYSIKMTELGPDAEERGFESLWVAEHSHIPASRKSPFPGGGDLPQMYYDTYDPFVALTAAAAVTQKIKLATGICLVIQRDPIHTAKEVASLDQVSDGRFLFGIGAGWNIEEMNDHGTPGEGRFKLMRERIEAMQQIWTQEQAEYHGDRVDFPPMFMNPKPVQNPYPPIHVGGIFPGGARRAIRYADGWIPIGGRGDISSDITEFRKMEAESGRSGLEVSVYGVPGKQDVVEQYRDAGVDRVVFHLQPQPREELLPYLDRLAEISQRVS